MFSMGFDIEKSFIMAERLKQLREEKGLSHEKLSKALFDQYGVKISSDSLINYEVADAGHTKAYKNQGMRVEYLRCLADFYGVSADYLLGITDIRTQDSDIKMVSEATGLSEKSVSVLCNAWSFSKIRNDPQFHDAEIIQRVKTELAEALGVLDFIECGNAGDGTEIVEMWGSRVHRFVNDLLDAYTSNFVLMDSYASMLQFGTKSIDVSRFIPEEFNNAASIITSNKFIILDPSEYVRFKSSEISKMIDYFLTEKYCDNDANNGNV